LRSLICEGTDDRWAHGAFTVVEAAADVLTLAEALRWDRFAVVGHSMSALVALHWHSIIGIGSSVLLS